MIDQVRDRHASNPFVATSIFNCRLNRLVDSIVATILLCKEWLKECGREIALSSLEVAIILLCEEWLKDLEIVASQRSHILLQPFSLRGVVEKLLAL